MTGAERRLVSVLFADLVAFTSYSEGRDPELVRETLTRYFEATREAIERHGGQVEKFIGDAVMAEWGAPRTNEDDAERAVRAALEVVTAVRNPGEDLHARVAVLTGQAAVTVGATDQGMVAGDMVNTAALLQGVAPPSTVLVGEATMQAASDAIAFEAAGEQILKGKKAPVRAWRALRVVGDRGGRSRGEGLEPPFVGREVELRLLKDLLHQIGEEQRPRLISITGPAGIGKSRLAWEFEKYIDGLVEDVYRHRGRAPSYGDGVTFWALGEMILARADGIPLYAVETVRMLVADGRLSANDDGTFEPAGDLGELAMPDSLRALVASRLDSLEEADRSLLQDAAVLGKTFAPDALAAIYGQDEAELEPRLRALSERELLEISVDPASPERGQFGFVQSVIREVAYDTLSRRDRRARHLAAARYFESLGDDELAGILVDASKLTETVEFLEAALTKVNRPEDEECRADMLARLSRAHMRLGDSEQAVSRADEALALAEPRSRGAAALRPYRR